MIAVDDVLVSEDLLESYFCCDLKACKGACCWEGDWGAPLEDAELPVLESITEQLQPYLPEESNAYLKENEPYRFFDRPGFNGTPLHPDGACVYLTKDQLGIRRCGIEMANEDGAINFKKPVSCHLYPVRVVDLKVGFAINYDRWHICSAACSKGSKLQLRLFEFVKDAIIRKFGKSFYEKLRDIAYDISP